MHGISPYTFKVIDEEGIQQDLWNLNNISFLDYLRNQYSSHFFDSPTTSQESLNGVVGKNYIFDRKFKSTEESFAGRYSTGEYGYEAEIFDNDKRSFTGKREKFESTMLPFHFCFYTPKSDEVLNRFLGLLILGRFNGYGIKSIVMPHLVTHFESAFPGLRLKIEKIVPTSFVNAVLKETNLKKIRLTTNKIPESYRSVFVGNDFDNVYEVETIIKPKPRSFFSKPSWLSELAHGVPIDTIISIPDVEITKLKVEVSRGKGRSRTINIADVHTMAANIEIEDPQLNSGNHITSESWMSEADSLADDIFLEYGLEIKKWNNSTELISSNEINKSAISEDIESKIVEDFV